MNEDKEWMSSKVENAKDTVQSNTNWLMGKAREDKDWMYNKAVEDKDWMSKKMEENQRAISESASTNAEWMKEKAVDAKNSIANTANAVKEGIFGENKSSTSGSTTA